MTSAGNVKETIRALEELQDKTDRSLNFLKLNLTEDLMQHVRGLRFKIKGAVNNILYSGDEIRNYPCVTKVFELEPDTAKGNFPKEKTKDPVTCAKILYVLYNNYPNKSLIWNIRTQSFQCNARCDTCYKLAFEEFYRHGTLRCKNGKNNSPSDRRSHLGLFSSAAGS